jgi:hypothetical protein
MPVKNSNQNLDFLKIPKIQAIIFLVITSFIGFRTHQAFIHSGFSINPDESELLATARLAAMPGGLSENYTTATYGPIWPEFLAILNHLGMRLDLFSAHLLAFILKVIIFLPPQYVAIKKNGFFKLAPALILINILLFTPTSHEFGFLTTGLLPLALLTAATFAILKWRSRISLAAAGILFTLSFFSKYQSFLMIVILVYFIFLREIKNGVFKFEHFKKSLIIFFGSIAFTVSAILFFLLTSDSLSKFFTESFLLSIDYATTGGFSGGQSIIEKFNIGSTLLVGQPLIIFASLLVFIIIQNLNFQYFDLNVMSKKYESMDFTLISLFLFLLIGFLTISIPGNVFPHYILFFVWALNIFFLSLNFLDTQDNSKLEVSEGLNTFVNKRASTGVLIFILMFGSLSSVIPGFKSIFNSSESIYANETRYSELNNAEILAFCPKQSQVLVWGWGSELFAYFDWVPVPNVVNDVARIKFSQVSDDQIMRVSESIKNNETDCIYEAFGPNFFGGFSPDQGVSSLPGEDLNFLNQNYRQTVLKDGTSVWSRNR